MDSPRLSSDGLHELGLQLVHSYPHLLGLELPLANLETVRQDFAISGNEALTNATSFWQVYEMLHQLPSLPEIPHEAEATENEQDQEAIAPRAPRTTAEEALRLESTPPETSPLQPKKVGGFGAWATQAKSHYEEEATHHADHGETSIEQRATEQEGTESITPSTEDALKVLLSKVSPQELVAAIEQVQKRQKISVSVSDSVPGEPAKIAVQGEVEVQPSTQPNQSKPTQEETPERPLASHTVAKAHNVAQASTSMKMRNDQQTPLAERAGQESFTANGESPTAKPRFGTFTAESLEQLSNLGNTFVPGTTEENLNSTDHAQQLFSASTKDGHTSTPISEAVALNEATQTESGDGAIKTQEDREMVTFSTGNEPQESKPVPDTNPEELVRDEEDQLQHTLASKTASQSMEERVTALQAQESEATSEPKRPVPLSPPNLEWVEAEVPKLARPRQKATKRASRLKEMQQLQMTNRRLYGH